MNGLLDKVIDTVGIFLKSKGYNKKGKHDFIKKDGDREVLISFTQRKGRGTSSEFINIGVTSSIYFKKVNTLDKKILKDFLNSYPIITGSIGHFKNKESGFISIPLNNLDQTDEVSKIIIQNLIDGAFNLFDTYPDLKSILLGIEKKDEWLKDYWKFLDFRNSIRLAAMYNIERGKENAIDWFRDNVSDSESEKPEILNKMITEW